MSERSPLVPVGRVLRDPYRLFLLICVLGYTVLFTGLAFAQHRGMRTHKADLGQIAQAVWNSSRGRFVEMTDNGFVATRMTDHVEPILALISPVLWLWEDVRALLLLQVIAVAVGAFFLYALALRRLERLLSPQERTRIWRVEPLRRQTRPLALVLALAYLLSPQLQSAVLTEFHAAPLVAPFVLWAFWAVDTRRWGQFVLAVVLVAGVKEEMALLAAGLGAWALYQLLIVNCQLSIANEPAGGSGGEFGDHSDGESEHDVNRRLQPIILSVLVIIGALVWFYVTTFVIVPAHAVEVYGVAESGYFQRYGALGDSPADILRSFWTQPATVWSIATQPARLDYLRNLLAGFGFLGLLAPEVLLLALPLLLANLLSAYPAQYYGEFHYSAPLIPYVAVAATFGLARVWIGVGRRLRGASGSFQHMPAARSLTMAGAALFTNARTALRPLLAMLLALWLGGWALALYGEAGRGPGGGRYDPTPITDHHRLLPRFVNQLPPDAAVTATAAVHPHLALRRYVYQFPMGVEPPGRADWALLDVTTNTDMAPGDLKGRVDAMLAADWGLVDAADGFLLLRKGAAAKTIPAAFYDFARAAPRELPAEAASLSTDPALDTAPLTFLHVAAADWPRWRQTQMVSYWHVGTGFDPATARPQLAVRTPGGESLYEFATSTPPALLWYPPARWQPGEVIRITTLPLYLPHDWGIAVAGAVLPPHWMEAPVSTQTGATLAATFRRREDERLVRLPVDLFSRAEPWLALPAAEHTVSGTFDTRFATDDTTWLGVEAALPAQPVAPGAVLDLWLHWRGAAAWSEELRPFVHVRQAGDNRAQSDGAPRWFVYLSPAEWMARAGYVNDWRQMRMPLAEMDGARGQVDVVVGLYDPQSGQRAALLDANGEPIGNELRVGAVRIAPLPVPDQACALIPTTCAAQPRR